MRGKKSIFSVLFCVTSVLGLIGCQETTIRAIENAEEASEAAQSINDNGTEITEMLPPIRPRNLGDWPQQRSESETQIQPEPAQIAVASRPSQHTQQPPPAPTSRAATQADIIAQANQYFNSFQTLTGSFTQVGSNRQRQTGQIYLLRPGRMRFDFDAPSTLQIIADGQNVAIRNTQTNRQDLYPLSQTPIQFLLRREIRLDRDLKIISARADKSDTIITVEDRSTLGGTARITLFFDPNITTLKSWDVTDAQGKKTTVLLNRIQINQDIGADNFVIPMKQRN